MISPTQFETVLQTLQEHKHIHKKVLILYNVMLGSYIDIIIIGSIFKPGLQNRS